MDKVQTDEQKRSTLQADSIATFEEKMSNRRNVWFIPFSREGVPQFDLVGDSKRRAWENLAKAYGGSPHTLSGQGWVICELQEVAVYDTYS